ncbi:MAG: T9SS type A sorting domain-containing protein, partial [Chitinophagales bacterium]
LLIMHSSLAVAQCSAPTNLSVTWAKSYGFTTNENAYSIELIDGDNDGVTDDGFVVVGYSSNVTTNNDGYAIRIDASGDTVWSFTLDGGLTGLGIKPDYFYAVEQLSNDSILICGSTKTKKFGPGLANNNVWVIKLDLNGNMGSGWPKEYGSTGNDVAYDVKEDQAGNYVLVGTASINGNDLGTQTIDPAGDYCVLKISPGGSVLASTVYTGKYNSNPANDFARSIIIDCNNNNYIVSGFCISCELSAIDQDLMLLRLSSSLSLIDSAYYGKWNFDHGSFNIIQPHSTFGTCASTDSFLSLGVAHPSSATTSCFLSNKHDVWAVKTDNNLNKITGFAGCTTDVNAGGTYGGKYQDNGQCAVQTCDGYLLAGFTKSNNQVLSCPNCKVTCNHYTATDPITSDIWLGKVNRNTGVLEWNESLGDIGGDGAYSIKRVPDGSYVVAGYDSFPISDNHGLYDFYVVKFELTDCSQPTGLSASSPACSTITFSWSGNGCDPSYQLQFRRGAGMWQVINTTATSYTASGLTSGTYSWKVSTKCSPNVYSAFKAPSSGFSLSCKEGELLSEESNSLTVYPNPADNSTQVTIQTDGSLAILSLSTLEGIQVYQSKIPVLNGLLERTIDLSTLTNGFYALRITINGNTSYNKLAVQHQ